MQTFQESFSLFLESVATKDDSTFIQSLDSRYFWQALLPDGKPRSSIEEFLESQKEWFQSKTGIFHYQILHCAESGELGIGVVQVFYQNQDNQGQFIQRHLQILFCFQKLQERWVLRYIQNGILSIKEISCS